MLHNIPVSLMLVCSGDRHAAPCRSKIRKMWLTLRIIHPGRGYDGSCRRTVRWTVSDFASRGDLVIFSNLKSPFSALKGQNCFFFSFMNFMNFLHFILFSSSQSRCGTVHLPSNSHNFVRTYQGQYIRLFCIEGWYLIRNCCFLRCRNVHAENNVRM